MPPTLTALAPVVPQPLPRSFIFAAFARCSCGAGMVLRGPDATHWTCSALERGADPRLVAHDRPQAVAAYDITKEGTRRAGNATTRPA